VSRGEGNARSLPHPATSLLACTLRIPPTAQVKRIHLSAVMAAFHSYPRTYLVNRGHCTHNQCVPHGQESGSLNTDARRKTGQKGFVQVQDTHILAHLMQLAMSLDASGSSNSRQYTTHKPTLHILDHVNRTRAIFRQWTQASSSCWQQLFVSTLHLSMTTVSHGK